ncbi:hypothetical protein [Primorskyibacter flagellatus]|uniref:Uncharacterized protein n=1 Tax=Primorskyibacter flagellatus TaxID=1387277 RepID=A0A1W2DYI2_9RHOB|nr:hypothetical protein [Primorskyibacter flagellatus]SMD02570.1 hypothetical protein SAMN06295998_11977 [Primorskyibacter flagellatus]
MTNAEISLHDDKMRAEIAHLAAQTTKLNKEIRWYEAVIIAGGASAVTLAIVALTKVLL